MALKRELIEPHKGDKRYVRRDDQGHFKKEVNVGRALAADRRAHAKKTVKPGQGDRGDVQRKHNVSGLRITNPNSNMRLYAVGLRTRPGDC
jgi:hypothetical protein